LAEIQIQGGCKQPLEILTYKEIRWLSLTECTARILELWKYLEIYFKESDSNLKEFFNEEYLLLSQLLSCLLNKLAYFNRYFQKDTLLYNQVIDKIKEGYVIFGQMLLKPDYENSSFDQIFAIPFDKPEDTDSRNKLATDEEFKKSFLTRYNEFGGLIESAKEKVRRGIEKEFFGIAKDFITKAIIQMKRRLPFNQETLNQSLVIYLEEEKFEIQTWRELGRKFPNIITSQRTLEFEEELGRFSNKYSKIKSKYTSPKTSILITWDLLDEDFPNMALLAKALIILPYSSSSVESTFSRLKGFVSPHRNRLSVENIEASLLISQSHHKKGTEITEDMVFRCSQIWDNQSTKKVGEIEETKTNLLHENHESKSNLQTNQQIEPSLADISNFEKLFTHLIHKALQNKECNSQAISTELQKEDEDDDYQDEIEVERYVYQSNSLKRKSNQNTDSLNSLEITKRVKTKDTRNQDT